jgi:hypothetical protein
MRPIAVAWDWLLQKTDYGRLIRESRSLAIIAFSPGTISQTQRLKASID